MGNTRHIIFLFFLLFTHPNIVLDKNCAEFEFTIGQVHVNFPFSPIENEKCKENQVPPSAHHQKLKLICINICQNTLFLYIHYYIHLMIIITCNFRNTGNHLKPYEITIFLTGWFSYWSITKPAESLSMSNSKAFYRHNFHCRDLKFPECV